MRPGEPGKLGKFVAPWPWICAVSPVGHAAIDETGWYRNKSSCVPGNVPRGTINYFAHEFAWNCVDPGGGAALKCDHVEPGISDPGGGFGFSVCSGGEDYRVTDKGTAKQACLTVAKVDPGKEVGVGGLNFLSNQR